MSNITNLIFDWYNQAEQRRMQQRQMDENAMQSGLQNLSNLAQLRARERENQQALKNDLEKIAFKQQLEQQDPTVRLLKLGQMGQALNSLGLGFNDLGINQNQITGMLGVNQIPELSNRLSMLPSVAGNAEQPLTQGGLSPSSFSNGGQIVPKTFKQTPFGIRAESFERIPTPEEASQKNILEGRGKGIEEAFKQAEGLKRATKRIGSITRQFNEALPDSEQFASLPGTTGARLSGLISTIGAKLGTQPNPNLLALQDTAKLQLRAILRDMGEGARLSDQDISQNIAVIEQAGLSPKEREAKVRIFLQTAIDSMDDSTLAVIKEDKSSTKLLEEFGVVLPDDNLRNKLGQLVGQQTQMRQGLSRLNQGQMPAQAQDQGGVEQRYNELRSKGYTKEQAKKMLGL